MASSGEVIELHAAEHRRSDTNPSQHKGEGMILPLHNKLVCTSRKPLGNSSDLCYYVSHSKMLDLKWLYTNVNTLITCMHIDVRKLYTLDP